jgi:hypothetical protein
MKIIHLILILFLVIVLTNNTAFADKSGRATRTSTLSSGCGNCHGSKSTATTLSIQSGSLTVDPGSTTNYTIRVANTNGKTAGIDISVKSSVTGEDNSGILSAGTGLKEILSELVQLEPKAITGGYADFSFSWQAPNVPGIYYMRACGIAADDDGNANSGDKWNWMDYQQITVRGVVLTEPIGGEGFCAGNNMIIKWKSAGIENIKIELSSNNGASWDITIQNSFNAVGGNYTYAIPSNIQQGPNYIVRISDAAYTARTSQSKNIFGIFGFYSIIEHPKSKDICTGDTLRLYVSNTGGGMTYQWRKNGANIPNATDSVYDINNASIGDGGFYGVLIKSPCMSDLSSSEAQINVYKRPVITGQPNSQILCLGENVTFQVEANGQDVKYQWFKESRELINETSYKLILTKVKAEDAGRYLCRISGFCEPYKISDTVSLIINDPPKIISGPESKKVCEKSKTELIVQSMGLKNTYRWYFKGTLINVPNSDTLTINSVTSVNAGDYYCEVLNPCGPAVKSKTAIIEVDPLPHISSQSSNKVVTIGDKVELFVDAVNSVTNYQWRFNKKNLLNQNSKKLLFDSIKLSDAGDYDCVVNNICGNVISLNIKIIVLSEAPGSRLNILTDSVSFGIVPLGYRKDSIFVSSIKNNGDSVLVISNIEFESNDLVEFFIPANLFPIKIDTNTEYNINLSFNPKSDGLRNSKMKFISNSIIDNDGIKISGFGGLFKIEPEKNVINLGWVHGSKDSTKVKLVNNGNYDVTIRNYKFQCQEENPFLILNPIEPYTLNTASSVDLIIGWDSVGWKKYMCGLTVYFEGIDSTVRFNILAESSGASVNEIPISEKFEIFPNPSKSNLTINFIPLYNGNYNINIIDLNGISVRTYTYYLFSGENTNLCWDGKNNEGTSLNSGLYIVKIINSLSSENHRFLLIK